MRVALFSSTVFGYRCLVNGILRAPQVKLTGIVTTPGKIPLGKGQKQLSIVTAADFSEPARRSDCELVTFENRVTVSQYEQVLEKWRPDFVLALGWYHIVPEKIIRLPQLGWACLHAALLPKGRGMAPINWAIINGERETGVTFFYLDKNVDSGDIIAQTRLTIDIDDTCASLYEKATQASEEILRRYLPRIAAGTAPRIKQNEVEATYYRLRTPADGLIDWDQDARHVYDFIRAQTHPYPGAFTLVDNRKLYIWRAVVTESEPASGPGIGEFVRTDRGTEVQCGRGRIRLLEVQWENQDNSGEPSVILADILNRTSA